MNARASRPRTLVLVLSNEIQLHRLLRSILEPTGRKVVAAPPSVLDGSPTERPDLVIVDLDRLDHHIAGRAKSAYGGAEILEVCNNYREEDGVAILEIGVDYLARPFRTLDLLAKVHAAEFRRLAAKGCRRYYRAGLGRPNALRDRQALRAFVCELRRKLESDPSHPEVLLNEARVGYRLVVEPGGPGSLGADEKRRQET